MTMGKINGRHVFAGFALGFGIIISVNMTLAVNAVRTFPGLEVKNSYVASQRFDAARAAQVALEWDVRAVLEGGELRLTIHDGERLLSPRIEQATFGRATHVGKDQDLEFVHDGTALVAPVNAGSGNWNLRLKARAADNTLFQQRIVVEVRS